MNGLGIDRRHHEGRDPRSRHAVFVRCCQVGLRRAGEAGRQGERIGEQGADGGILLHRCSRRRSGSHRATREPAIDCAHPPADTRGIRAEPLLRRVLHEQDAKIEGNGIETAREDQPRPALFCGRFMLRDHPCDPVRLPGEVDIVRSRPGAGGDQLVAIELIWTGSRQHHCSSLHHAGQRSVIVGVSDDQGGVGRRADEVTDVGKPGRVPAGHGPFHIATICDEIFCNEPACVTAGAVHHDVEFTRQLPVPSLWCRPASPGRPPAAAGRTAFWS